MLSDKVLDVSCDYCCVFGISKPCTGVDPGSVHSSFRTKRSLLVAGGPGGRVYWFYFFKLSKTTYGSGIPEFTKSDEAKFLKEHENDIIMSQLTFGDLIKARISSTMTALQEHVYKQWHFDRIVTIGDAVHKVVVRSLLRVMSLTFVVINTFL